MLGCETNKTVDRIQAETSRSETIPQLGHLWPANLTGRDPAIRRAGGIAETGRSRTSDGSRDHRSAACRGPEPATFLLISEFPPFIGQIGRVRDIRSAIWQTGSPALSHVECSAWSRPRLLSRRQSFLSRASPYSSVTSHP